MTRRFLVILAAAIPCLAQAQMTLSEELGLLSGKSAKTELRIEKDARPKPGESNVRTVTSSNTVITVQEERPAPVVSGASVAHMGGVDSVSAARPREDFRVGGRVVAPPVDVVNAAQGGAAGSMTVDAVTVASAELDLATQRQARAQARLKTVVTDERKTMSMYRSKLKKMSSTPAVTEQERSSVQKEMETRQAEFDALRTEAEKVLADANEVVSVKKEYLASLNAAVAAEQKRIEAERKSQTQSQGAGDGKTSAADGKAAMPGSGK